jgi:proteasome activator subunit 4
VERNADWRNDFCRYVNYVECAFDGIPTLAREIMTEDDRSELILKNDTT